MEYSEDGGAQRAAAASPAPYFDAVARRILAQHAPPDLRHLIVLLPNHHAAQPLARALVREADVPALLLPQMLTLQEWVQSAVPDLPVIPESRRSALLYQQLRRRRWFDQSDLWGMTHELLSLFDELTHALDTLPEDEAAFAEAVQRASDARDSATLQLEAHLVAALWQAMQSGAEIDEARARQQRLAVLAARARGPLYVLRTAAWNALEQRFLDAWAEREPVEACDMRELAAGSFIAAHDTSAGLRACADELCAAGVEMLTGKLKFFAATSLEGLDLFSTSSRIAGVGPAINLPIFEAGRLRANLRGSYAEYDTAVADYNQALINALRQVADQITSLRTARERLATQALALAAANDAYRLTLDRYRSGLTNYLDVLINEQRLLAERLEHVRLEGQCLAHAVQTIRALGGGYHVPQTMADRS